MVSPKQWQEAVASGIFKAYPERLGACRAKELVSFEAPTSRIPKRAFCLGQTIPCDDGVYISKCGRWRVEVSESRVRSVEKVAAEGEWDYWYKSRPGRLW